MPPRTMREKIRETLESQDADENGEVVVSMADLLGELSKADKRLLLSPQRLAGILRGCRFAEIEKRPRNEGPLTAYRKTSSSVVRLIDPETKTKTTG